MLEFTLIPVLALLIISGLIYGMFGFGYAIVSVALLPFFMSVKTAVPMVAAQAIVLGGWMLYGLRQHIRGSIVLPILVGLPLGLPLGVYMLHVLSEESIRRLLGSVVLLYVLWSLVTVSQTTSLLRSNVWGLLAGFLSGIIGGAILASGPIIIIYLTLRGFKKEEFKATFLLWATVQGCLLVPFYALSEMLTSRALLWGFIALPFAGLGIFLGVKLFEKVKEQVFYRLVIVLLAISAVHLLLS
jgi:uncharacterized membrane protein YfcA